jgi:hypothetical protein
MSNKKIITTGYLTTRKKLNYLKSSLSHEEVERWLREYERRIRIS